MTGIAESRPYDVIVLGGGAPGEHCAGALAEGGLAVVERDLVGGECSYWACLPSKSLLRPGAAIQSARHGAANARVDVEAPLTHVGEHQGEIVAANILGESRAANYEAVPRVVHTDPQATAVGVGEARFSGTALLSEVPKTATYTHEYAESNGFLTLLSDGTRLTGAFALGPEAGEWLQQATLAIRACVPLVEVLRDIVQPFPNFLGDLLRRPPSIAPGDHDCSPFRRDPFAVNESTAGASSNLANGEHGGISGGVRDQHSRRYLRVFAQEP